jgi:CDP-glycerol glycerophosphotransferase (TagB/SpsB family)/glycosyltransferase involved in cell wall biosynthesis
MQKSLRRLRQFGRKLRRAGIAELRAWASRGAVKPRTVLYESFAGNGVLCNPEAIFRGLLADHDFDDMRHVWALDSLRAHPGIRREFWADRRVRFVRRGTAAYFHALATSGYLINNATFPPEFSKRPGQTYLNTWHGTPLKLMGYDMPNGALESANTLKNFLAADWLLSQNPFMTERMYGHAYRLSGVFRGRILEAGYPRVDRQRMDQDAFLAAHQRLEQAGIRLGSRSLVLLAPTWKGDSFANPHDDALELAQQAGTLQRLLGENFVVALKTHQSVHAFARSRPEFDGLLVPNDVPTNVVLGVASALITDYSSIFFDYLASDRPVVFFTPKADDYERSRGTYFRPDELPGPVYTNLLQVAAALLAHFGGDIDLSAEPRYGGWHERFASMDDGHATDRVIDAVFRGSELVRGEGALPVDARRRIVLYLGGMRSNGITSSALNLLRAIDHDRFDVSVIIARPFGEEQLRNQALIDPQVRQFHRIGGMNGNKAPHLRRRRGERRGRGGAHLESPSQSRLWDDEWNRCFGDAEFDAVVDFSGYSAFWATLMLHSPRAVRSIWLHNDMAAEEHRVIRGRARMQQGLRAVFALYPQFDRLVSVSASLREVNQASLAGVSGIDPERFVTARNLVDAPRVLDGLVQPLASLEDPPPEWMDELSQDRDTPWFVSIGRFSTEKNQARLLRAFATVRASRPDARLIIVGYGPLREELLAQVADLGLSHSAVIAGPFANPFPILAAADCFVLSSDYEGQPMVLLEAAIAGLPIISVAFESVGDALAPGRIHVVEQDDDALAEGMLAFLRGEVAPAGLDVVTYSAEAVDEFVRAVLPQSILRSVAQDSRS